jgi:rhodanese-related sulfurtransferase
MPLYRVKAPDWIRHSLLVRTEIALLDVRMESEFARGHPLFAASFPLGQLESLAAERLPRPCVPVVVYGPGGRDAGLGSVRSPA